METRAPYVLIGLFVLAAFGAAFGFVYWLNNAGSLGKREVYRLRFENTVSGLVSGAAVLFDGIRVGEVTDLGLNPDNPREVMATIAVATGTPVRSDTEASLDFQGLSGVPVVALKGGSAQAAPLASVNGGPPVLAADPSAGQSMTEAARATLNRLDSLLADNSDNVKSTIANLETFTAALARNSGRLDAIISGLERMTGGEAAKAVPTVYDLVAPSTFPPIAKPTMRQLAVLDPSAVVALDTQRILISPAAGEGPAVENAQWSDTIPKLLQEKIVQSFENSHYFAAVAKPIESFMPDDQLLIDVRTFELEKSPQEPGKFIAHVAFSAKILGDKGRIMASRTFDAEASSADTSAAHAAAAFDEAFRSAVTELAQWTAEAI